MTNVCPYKVLDISQNCSIDELKSKFKSLAFKYHPDKGGDKYLFDLITTSFKSIYKDIKEKNNSKQFYEMKMYSDASKKESTYVVADDNFSNKFNSYFEKNKTNDPNMEKGYEMFMNETDVKVSNKHYKLQKYKEPEGTVLCKSLNFIELGADISDFSGKNDDRHKLQFMDYQYAHTTSKLVDEHHVKERQQYKNLDDIKNKRSNENFDMTDLEKKYHEKMNKLKQKKEEKRIQNVAQYDNYLQKHFEDTNKLMIT